MPSILALSDAAIALTKALDDLGVEHGIFGGYAVAILGGPRASKDIDCVVNCNKEWLVERLSAVEDFSSMGNARPDLAVFMYKREVLVELFPASMSSIDIEKVDVQGDKSGIQATKLLNPVFVYKGKLQAAATRAKYSDAVDLLFLEGRYGEILRAQNRHFNRLYVGIALRRYSHLEASFRRLDLDVEASRQVAKDVEIEALPRTSPPNAVQNGLMFNVRVP
ncbi:hypothetical protein KVT40_000829 [Elsinoe batatas]|uniref:Uncharacterized protein n=1 Tax=Elsinoe batatas TaxID=2601811 RepID=A0A8K0LAT2_9PEZI|nr:hypothetical protein KVT40_000829 [Elsinoe batatas]